MQIKMVLCGGPCGGKTTSLNKFKSNPQLKEYIIHPIEETATFLFDLGYAPNENISPFDFQNLLMKLQYLKEYIAEKKIASQEKGIIVCDRGLLDGSIYLEPDKFGNLLKENALDRDNVSRTYDFALYLESISKTNPELFSKLRLYEAPEIGALRDDKSYQIWAASTTVINPLTARCLQEKIEYAIKYVIDNYNKYKDSNLKLCDFYNDEHFEFIKFTAMELLKKYPTEFEEKQKQLIKRLSKVSVI